MDFKGKIKQELINEDIHLSLTNKQRESVSELTDYLLRLYIVKYRRELLVAFLEMLENTPLVEIPLNVGMVAVDEFLSN